MNIVEQVAVAIEEIPGNPSTMEVARIAIEAYQMALWPPFFDKHARTSFAPEMRHRHATALSAHIMHIIGDRLCEHGEAENSRDVSRELFQAIYEAGAYIVTDVDRSTAGLPMRDHTGLTPQELQILEMKRTEAMLRPMPPMVLAGL